MLDAGPPRGGIPFIGIYGDAHNGTLSIFGAGVNLIRVGDSAQIERPKPVPLALHHGARRRLLRLKRGPNAMLPFGPVGAFSTSLDAQHSVIAKLGKAAF